MPAKGNPIHWVQTVLKPGDVFIDGGANVGTVTEAAAKIVGSKGRVIAVEPDHRCSDALKALQAKYPQIVLEFVPLGDGHDAEFFESTDSPHSSLYERNVKQPYIAVPIHTVRITHLLIEHHPVSAVKLDLQGAEPLIVTDSALDLCQQWCVELWPWGTRGLDDMVTRFKHHGFTPHWMDDGYPEAPYDDLLAYVNGTHGVNEHINVVFTR
jgi:FkbM family methyltransferase